jgi:hypothetical protein
MTILNTMDKDFIAGLRKQFDSYKVLGEKTINQLTTEQMNWKPNETSNSIANIVTHLHGNMLSRWTNFLTEDGEKPWRKREEEFESANLSKEQLLEFWQEGWACLFSAIDIASLTDLTTIIYIRNQPHTIMDALLRQLAHYPHHVGQIVYIGKMLLEDGWESLSIPKGGTEEFNRKLFGDKLEK